MSLRSAALAFFVLLGLVAAALGAASRMIVRRSVPVEPFLSAARASESRGELDLAGRLMVKGVFYSAEPERFIQLAAPKSAFADYLNGLLAIRRVDLSGAEGFLSRAAASGAPLLATRAKLRLDHVRYGTGLPHMEEIPF
ncbi:MAG: hypothetical protein A3G34_03025 [Candidatus Lindowbacteria bacterium RIFCSPLOWO2_12_FULL_62_27]|nr:MAG: hypothetical protein A3G34_03025 [Candidatus Lindowbacteria bacterium RIFCSPLOWO2_12_FULL_62_27]OGH62220.1 MAG: hypothetical protein A3I06_05330 [Candidatus Lindowbacteria bacterium RIFCSPLOWO2_02_FULL_62_12]